MSRLAGPAVGRSLTVLAWLGLVVVVGFLTVVVSSVVDPGGGVFPGARPWMLALCLMSFACGTYLVWPSRWNVVAHTQFAFGIAAYVVPLLFLNSLDRVNDDVLTFYLRLMVPGAGIYLFGLLVGAAFVRPAQVARLRDFFGEITNREVELRISRRVIVAGALAVLGIAVSFAVMGFAPAFADDPLLAKFFRGPYQGPYQRVAPLYRASTAVLTLLLPILTVVALRSRRAWPRMVLVGAVVVLALSLTRGPTVNGLLMAVGVWVAVRRKSLALFLVALVAVYFFGAVAYVILDSLGLRGFVAVPGATQTLLERVAAGAPDVEDHFSFLSGFMQHPVFADGRTFYGGLIPGHYRWNPAIYSLEVANPGQQGSELQSGGFRLPAPLLGYANLGWAGVVLVSSVSGVLAGYLTGLARHLVPSGSVLRSVRWIAVYALAMQLFPLFYRMTYMTMVQFVFCLLLLRVAIPDREQGVSVTRGKTRPTPGSPPGGS